ncbi:hypothetical protein ACFWM7_17435 [Streptomyces sp. NPDC058375]|uniref:hypothetical protein n=1 Tax=Streptomyces sp. NPDC058375 TaxID=3346467 RepID=UPI00365BE505
METSDPIGPLGAKSMSESPFNPVAPAFANALRDETGIRFTELPPHTFEGPLLREVVADAGPAFDVRRRKDRSRFLLAVTGGDGHHAVLPWAEIDAVFGDAPMLLATRVDDRPLEPDGSQLVMPRDRCGTRYVSAITRVWVGAAHLPPYTGG